ncbi:MAG: hypothetical protein K1Y36_13100 [Blastocatellia bacterium]|nr:hypothetical protein [Blastocatellia bacterium]
MTFLILTTANSLFYTTVFADPLALPAGPVSQSSPIEFGSQGDTQVFRVRVGREILGDHDIWRVTARSRDANAFAVSVMYDTGSLKSTEGRLSPGDQQKYDEWNKKQTDLYTQLNGVAEKMSKQESRASGLKALLEEKSLAAGLRTEVQAQLSATNKDLESLRKQQTALQQKLAQVQQEAPQVDWKGGMTEDKPAAWIEVFGRLRSSGPAEIAVVLVPKGDEPAKVLATIPVQPPAKLPANPDLVKGWARAWMTALGVEAIYGGETRFHIYEIHRVARQYEVEPPEFLGRLQRGSIVSQGETSQVDLFSVTTGGLAIEESLQANKILRPTDETATGRVPLAKLSGPNIKSHPFEEMLKGREPVMFDMAGLVPHDQYYLHFSNLRAEIELSDLLDNWGTSLLQSMDVTSRDRKVKDRILGQLAIELSTLTRLFGDLVIGEIGFTGNDPFLTDGNDVTVLFQVKNTALFESAMQLHRSNIQKKHPEAETGTVKYGDSSIDYFRTADRSVSSYRTTVGACAIYSNSLAGLQRMLDVSSGKRASLKTAGDFRYMRTVFPGTEKEEDGFLYLSDAFIRRVVGPEQKINRLRQLICVSHLREMGYGQLHQRIETGKSATIADLTAHKLLDEEDQICPAGGRYTFRENGEAACSVHGSFRYLTPLVEIPLTDATQGEADGYKRFVEEYNQYWSRFFDPVGIRFRLKEKIEVETCILPLIENSIYNGVRETAGGEPVRMELLRTGQTIGTVGFKIPANSPEVKNMLRDVLFDRNGKAAEALTQTLGDAMTLNICDAAPLFTFGESVSRDLLGTGVVRRGDSFFIGSILSALTLPIYVTLDVKDVSQAKQQFDRAVQAGVRQSQIRGDRFLQIEDYTLNPYRGVEIRTLKLQIFVVDFRLFCAFVGKKLVVATQRNVLTDLIDAQLNGTGTVTASQPANLLLEMRPENFDRIRTAASTHWQERMRETCLANLAGNRVLLDWLGISPEQLSDEALARFGYVPFCPSAGTYQFDRQSGQVSCSIHGSRANPHQPTVASEREPFVNFTESLKTLNVSFGFTPEGIRTKLTIERKK